MIISSEYTSHTQTRCSEHTTQVEEQGSERVVGFVHGPESALDVDRQSQAEDGSVRRADFQRLLLVRLERRKGGAECLRPPRLTREHFQALSMDWFLESARKYKLTGMSLAALCDHNGHVAYELDRPQVRTVALS